MRLTTSIRRREDSWIRFLKCGSHFKDFPPRLLPRLSALVDCSPFLVNCLTASFVAFCLLLFCAITSSPFVGRLKQAINAGNKSWSKFIKGKKCSSNYKLIMYCSWEAGSKLSWDWSFLPLSTHSSRVLFDGQQEFVPHCSQEMHPLVILAGEGQQNPLESLPGTGSRRGRRRKGLLEARRVHGWGAGQARAKDSVGLWPEPKGQNPGLGWIHELTKAPGDLFS